jgi:hypothetical protein
VLRPGDVISLAGVSVIYGEEDYGPEPPAPPAADAGQTQPPLRHSDPQRQTDLLTPPSEE